MDTSTNRIVAQPARTVKAGAYLRWKYVIR